MYFKNRKKTLDVRLGVSDGGKRKVSQRSYHTDSNRDPNMPEANYILKLQKSSLSGL